MYAWRKQDKKKMSVSGETKKVTSLDGKRSNTVRAVLKVKYLGRSVMASTSHFRRKKKVSWHFT